MPRVALCGWNLAPGIGMAPMGRSSCSDYFSELERSSSLKERAGVKGGSACGFAAGWLLTVYRFKMS
jgi:hypothetical protein